MATFKKKDLNELVGGDMNSLGGDRNATNNSEIETGPVQKPHNDSSDFEAGTPTTSDRVFGRYVQNIPWFAVYSYGGRNNSSGGVRAFENTVLTKKTVEEKIDDLVKKSKSSDLTDKNYNPKISKLIDTIEDLDLTEKQLDDLKKKIEDKRKEIKTVKTL